jgi:hypothetical protein
LREDRTCQDVVPPGTACIGDVIGFVRNQIVGVEHGRVRSSLDGDSVPGLEEALGDRTTTESGEPGYGRTSLRPMLGAAS